MAKDSVCGMEVKNTKISSSYKGVTYYFCSENCKKEFEKNPEKYVGKAK